MRSLRGRIPWIAFAALVLAACEPAAPSDAPAVTAPGARAATATDAPAATSVPAAYSAASGAQMVILLAAHAGLFREQGLDVELPLLGGGAAIRALVAGQIAFTTLPGAQLVNAAVGGADVVAVAQDMDAVGMALHAAPSIRDLSALRGKRVGMVVPGTLTDLVARVAIHQAGLRVDDDVALINVGGGRSLVSALAADAIDAAPLAVPTSLRATEAGFPEMADVATLGPAARIVGNHLASHRDYLAREPAIARRFVDAYAAAVRRAREDPATTQAALTRWLQLDDPAVAEATYRAYVRLLNDPPVPSPEPWKALLDVLAEVPGIDPAVRTTPPESLIDTRFVRD